MEQKVENVSTNVSTKVRINLTLLNKLDNLNNRSRDGLDGLWSFYANHYHIQKFIELRLNERLSLRFINWFCVTYCRDHPVCYRLNNGKSVELFNVYDSYRAYLNAYKKRRFDPINRGATFLLVYHSPAFHDDEEYQIVTSLSQLNFFKWFIDNMVYRYMELHYDELSLERSENNVSEGTSNRSEIVMIGPIEIYLKLHVQKLLKGDECDKQNEQCEYSQSKQVGQEDA